MHEEKPSDAQVYKRLTDEYNPGNQGDLGGSFMEKVQRAVRMTRMGDACQRIRQVKIRFFSNLYENDSSGELRTEGRCNMTSRERCFGESCKSFERRISRLA